MTDNAKPAGALLADPASLSRSVPNPAARAIPSAAVNALRVRLKGPAPTAPDLNQQIRQHQFTEHDTSAHYDDTRRLFRVYSSLPEEKRLFLHTLEGHEALNELFEFRVELVSRSDEIELKELMGTPLVIGIRQTDGSERLLSGYVREFSIRRNNVKGWAVYAATLVPWTYILTMNQDSRCVTDKTVRRIIEDVLAPYGPSARYEFRLRGDYVAHDFTVQYQQSDMDFIAALIEREGWTTTYEHGFDGQKFIITDDTVSAAYCAPLPVYPEIEFNGADRVLPYSRVREFHAVRELQPTHFTLDTFDYKRPRAPRVVQMPTVAEQGRVPSVEVFDGSPAYAFKNRSQGDRYARIRIEEHEALAKRFQGYSDCPDLRPGGTTRLTGHPQFTQGEADRLLITRVEHHGRNDIFNDIEDASTGYHNAFHCMRQKVPYRPPLAHPRAVIAGTQTAIVTGPPGHEIWTNKDGCITVRFHWDRRAQFDDRSSCWIRVAQTWAGAGWGAVSIPRVGQEVLVGFMDGNPDRPVVIGSLYNGDQAPPYALPAGAHMMGFKSNSTPGGGGYSEMVIHDTKGSELVNVRSQKNLIVTALNDHATSVGNNQTTTVKQHVHIESLDADIFVKAKTRLTIACGDNAEIVLTEAGDIFINSKRVFVNGSESVDLNSGGNAAINEAPAGPAESAALGTVGPAGGPAAAGPSRAKKLIKTKLGGNVDALMNKSPTIQKDYATLRSRGWQVNYGRSGGGSYADRDLKVITIDSAKKDDPAAMAQTLSHEFGHALYPYKEDASSKSAYVNGTLADEGAATLNNIRAQREILATGSGDIGIAGNTANQPAYNAAYDQFKKDGNAAAAREAIGSIYGAGERTSNTGQAYSDYYGSFYDSVHPSAGAR